MIITVRFSTENDPTPQEIDWVRKAIRDKLEERGELRDPKILSVATESGGIIYPPNPVLTEELWQAIKARIEQDYPDPEPATDEGNRIIEDRIREIQAAKAAAQWRMA